MTDEQKNLLVISMTKNLHMLRAKLNLTQQDLSNILGISRQTYLSFENGQRKMSWAIFLSLFMIFENNCETNQLLDVLGIRTNELNNFLKRG